MEQADRAISGAGNPGRVTARGTLILAIILVGCRLVARRDILVPASDLVGAP
jgi:hypothetical protein